MTRTEMIAEIERLVGKGRWDSMSDEDLEVCLTNSRIYSAGHKDADDEDDNLGAIRMDARDRVVGRVETSRVDDADEEAAKANLRRASRSAWRGDADEGDDEEETDDEDEDLEPDPQDLAARKAPDETAEGRAALRAQGGWAQGTSRGRTREQALAALRTERERPAPGTASTTGKLDSRRHVDAIDGGSIYDQVAGSEGTPATTPTGTRNTLPPDQDEQQAYAAMRERDANAWRTKG